MHFIKKKLFTVDLIVYFLLTFLSSSFMKYLTLFKGTASPFIVRKPPPQVPSWPRDAAVVQSVVKDKALLILLFFFFWLPARLAGS